MIIKPDDQRETEARRWGGTSPSRSIEAVGCSVMYPLGGRVEETVTTRTLEGTDRDKIRIC